MTINTEVSNSKIRWEVSSLPGLPRYVIYRYISTYYKIRLYKRLLSSIGVYNSSPAKVLSMCCPAKFDWCCYRRLSVLEFIKLSEWTRKFHDYLINIVVKIFSIRGTSNSTFLSVSASFPVIYISEKEGKNKSWKNLSEIAFSNVREYWNTPLQKVRKKLMRMVTIKIHDDIRLSLARQLTFTTASIR